MIDITKAEQINGWMSIEELQWLAAQATRHKLIVEIGSYKGRSTRALGDNTTGVVIAIDHWLGEAHLDMSAEQRAKLYDTFYSNLADLIEAKKVIPLKLDHKETKPNLNVKLDFRPDFVFIDGDHSYESVKHDIQVWLEEVQSGGIICGHDAAHPPVAQAVQELIKDVAYAPNTSIWYSIV